MNHAFLNALVVEVEDLLAEVVVLDEHRPARTLLEGILIVGDRLAVQIGQDRETLLGTLVELTALTHRSAENRDLLSLGLIFAPLGGRPTFRSRLLGSRCGFRGCGWTLRHDRSCAPLFGFHDKLAKLV
jgi:hypothetical protein